MDTLWILTLYYLSLPKQALVPSLATSESFVIFLNKGISIEEENLCVEINAKKVMKKPKTFFILFLWYWKIVRVAQYNIQAIFYQQMYIFFIYLSNP